MSKPVILIISCQRDRDRAYNAAIRNTWGKRSEIPYVFFIGYTPCSVCLADEELVSVPDDRQHLTYKRQASIRWALDQDYTHFFCAFTDTYINTKRLKNSCFENHDYTGQAFSSSVIQCAPFCDGGCGYWLSRKAGELVSASPIESAHDGEYEDSWIGSILEKRGIVPFHDTRYSMGESWGNTQQPVLASNQNITCHLSRATNEYYPQWMYDAYRGDADRQ